MPLIARLNADRADRITIDRRGTLRDLGNVPIDVLVEDLSETGCLLRFEDDAPVDDVVSIGIPGIGSRMARLARIDRFRCACEFEAAISAADIEVARSQDTLVTGVFDRKPEAAVGASAESAEPLVEKYPPFVRVAIMLGGSAALWTGIIAGGLRLLG